MSANRPIPIILDTDIGDNVDDALALVFACQSPELNLLGVTTVHRDPGRRAAIARVVLQSLGRDDVPVAAGARGAPGLMRECDGQAPRYFETDFSRHLEHVDRRHATQFLIDLVAEAPIEPVTICSIGPLTNVAAALDAEQGLVERTRVVLMGGTIASERLETNMSADPEAARIVFASGADITMVGLDVTLQCQLAADDVERIKSAGHTHTRLVSRMIDAWMRDSGRLPVLHDPLAVAVCFDPSLCELEPAEVTVETAADRARGRTIVRPCGESRTRVCTTVARNRFVELFLNRVCSAQN